MKSKKPKKQRKEIFASSLHRKNKLLSAHLPKPLREQYKRRSLTLRKGDEVKIIRGKHKGQTGKISKIDLKKTKIYIENIKRKKVSGEEAHIPFHPSNLLIQNPVMDDIKRKKIIQRKVK